MHERRFSGEAHRLRSPDRMALLEVDRVVRSSLDGVLVGSVLDVGTGTGVFAEAFAGHGLAVTGIDTNSDLLELAREYVPGATFRQAPAEDIPFADGEFDIVFLGHVLHETDHPAKALTEARRVGLVRVSVLEWPYREEEHGPPLRYRLRSDEVESLAGEAGYAGVRRIELARMHLYLLDPGQRRQAQAGPRDHTDLEVAGMGGVETLVRRMKSGLGKVLHSAIRRRIRVRQNADAWSKQAQEGEFRFHAGNKWRQSEDFMAQTIGLFDSFGFSRRQYDGRTIIDLGSGSKLRTKYFQGARIIAIEPLADRFMVEIEWCDLKDASEVYSVPAEERIEQCRGRADLVISINVLDHCFDFPKIMENVRFYLKRDGLVFLSFDKQKRTDSMHPLKLDEAICKRIFEQTGFVIEKVTRGTNGILPGDVYGHGFYCLNYWLRRSGEPNGPGRHESQSC
jgi:2-polyprenyl-3-methyl-5-hydroxy-6-metoxy-1,4-benzoquinol methylase